MNNITFRFVTIVAWLIFVGLCIEASALIVNFGFSVFKPEFVGNLYQKLDMSALYFQSKWVFFGAYSFILFIAILKAVLFYMVIDLLHKLNLSKPFNSFVARRISQISYLTLSIGIVNFLARQTVESLTHQGYTINNLNEFWIDSEAFILMAAVIYTIAAIFNKGIEIQNENELTV